MAVRESLKSWIRAWLEYVRLKNTRCLFCHCMTHNYKNGEKPLQSLCSKVFYTSLLCYLLTSNLVEHMNYTIRLFKNYHTMAYNLHLTISSFLNSKQKSILFCVPNSYAQILCKKCHNFNFVEVQIRDEEYPKRI